MRGLMIRSLNACWMKVPGLKGHRLHAHWLKMSLMLLLASLAVTSPAVADTLVDTDAYPGCPALLQHEFTLLHDVKKQNLCTYSGKVVLVVNTASRCGFTPQLEGLEALYQKYREQGFAILGFPSNDFFQEYSDEGEVASFCKENYGVTFPMFSTSSVRGSDANSFYLALIAAADTSPKWNFFKYLIDRNGEVVGVYSSRVKPDDEKLVKKIEALLSGGQLTR